MLLNIVSGGGIPQSPARKFSGRDRFKQMVQVKREKKRQFAQSHPRPRSRPRQNSESESERTPHVPVRPAFFTAPTGFTAKPTQTKPNPPKTAAANRGAAPSAAASAASTPMEKVVGGPISATSEGPVKHLPNKNIRSSLFTKDERIAVEKGARTSAPLQGGSQVASSSTTFSADTFAALDISDSLVKHLKGNLEMENLTHIQQMAVPHLLNGRDVLMQARTGAGKTLAFVVPIVQQLQAHNPRITRADGTFAIVIAPTRELAGQILQVVQQVARPFYWLVPCSIMGGEKKKSEKARLRKGATILVASPGRLLDHLRHTESFNVEPLEWLVLDEADRLMDMGFEKDLVAILDIIKSRAVNRRQACLLSATLGDDVERLAKFSLEDPIRVDESNAAPLSDDTAGGASKKKSTKTASESALAAPAQLQQKFVIVPAKQRLVALCAFIFGQIRNNMHLKAVVFTASRDCVDFLHHVTTKVDAVELGLTPPAAEEEDGEVHPPESIFGLPCYRLHGNMTQQERTSAYKSFCDNDAGILICTDVAARGLDLPNVSWILQYDPPTTSEDYVHRVGRTARLGRQGAALLFVLPSEEQYVGLLRERGMTLEPVELGSVLGGLKTTPRTSVESQAVLLQEILERHVGSNQQGSASLARNAFHSYVRAYGTHTASEKHIFHVKSLHLGHMAKAFALRDAPSHMQSGKPSAAPPRKKKREDESADARPKMTGFKRKHSVSEFSGGDDTPARAKTSQPGKNFKRPRLLNDKSVKRDMRPVGPQ